MKKQENGSHDGDIKVLIKKEKMNGWSSYLIDLRLLRKKMLRILVL
jgi:hypothetical protein